MIATTIPQSDLTIIQAVALDHPAGGEAVMYAVNTPNDRAVVQSHIRLAVVVALEAGSMTPISIRHRGLGWSYGQYYRLSVRAAGKTNTDIFAEYRKMCRASRRTYEKKQ